VTELKYTDHLARSSVSMSVYYLFQRPAIQITRPMGKFHVLDNFCILQFYIGVYCGTANSCGIC
jgi:hypothetical protein